MGKEYIAQIKVPKNCYFCKHLDSEHGEDEYSSSYYICNREPEVKNVCGDKFDENLHRHKRCYTPIEYISFGYHKAIKVEVL
jgi:hypothetical protein